jgi:hypothetical protein
VRTTFAEGVRRGRTESGWSVSREARATGSCSNRYSTHVGGCHSTTSCTSRFGLAKVQGGSPERLGRLLMALSIALSWLTLAALSEIGALPKGFYAAVYKRGRASLTSLTLALLDKLGN